MAALRSATAKRQARIRAASCMVAPGLARPAVVAARKRPIGLGANRLLRQLVACFSGLPVEERKLVGDLAVVLLLGRACAVAGVGIDTQENWPATGSCLL